jgi:hypothetical protein
MKQSDKNTEGIRPYAPDPWSDSWSKMDRFSRICWYWQAENAYIRESVGNTIQLEQLLDSYEYLGEHLLEPCRIDVSRSQWSSAVNAPLNTTTRHRIGKWSDWSERQKTAFLEICGEEMLNNGYEI